MKEYQIPIIFIMTTNPTETNDPQEEPKELWEIYDEHYYIDAKDNQGDWRVGYIVEKNPLTKIYKVRFDGWSSKYDELYKFTSGKLIQFRSVVIGYTGQRKHPGIRTDWKFSLQDILERIAKFKEFVNRKQKSARQINQFFRGHNYFYIDFLMTRSYDSMEAFAAVMQYYKLNIEFCVQYLRNIDPEFIQYYRAQQIPQQTHTVNPQSAMAYAFYQIMDTLFLIIGGYQRLNAFFENSALIKKYLSIEFEKNVKKYYQIYIVQEFNQKGGFEVIQNLIEKKLQNSKAIIPFLFLKSLTSLYHGLSSHLSLQDKNPWMQKLVQITRTNIQKLKGKDVKDLNKSHVTDLLETIKILFDNTEKEQQVEKWAIDTEVKLCKLMILCPFFEKKLKGVIGLIEIADKNRMQPQSDYFVHLLLQYNILQCLFSSDNAEIIKKSADFCKTLFFIDIFPKKSIFKIWEMRIGKHEAALQEIYSLMSVIPSKPADQQFNVELFEQISKIKPQQWDEDYIKMIKEYSLSAIGWAGLGQKVNNLYGFNILYRYLLMKKNDFALTSFVQLLDRLEKTDIISKFVEKCFKNIGANEQSQIHVQIMLKMIQDQICSLKDIEQDYSNPVIKDILKHTDETQQIIQKKLELLSQVTKIMSITITFQQFQQLWFAFKNKKGENAFLNWIQRKKEGGKMQINNKINTQIRSKIFETIWFADYDYSKMQEKQAEIFLEFFRSVNIIKGNIKRINLIIKIDNLKLHGLDKIWNAFENNSKPKISDMLADLIAQLHICPTKPHEAEKQAWVKKLIFELSSKLQEAYQENNVEKINKFLLVFKKIIERDEELYSTKQSKYSMMKDYAVVYRANKEQKLVRFNVGGYCYDFKKVVCEKFKIPFKRCKLSCKGEVFKYENYFKTMIESSFSIGSPFQIEIISGQIPSVKQCINSELELFFQLLGDKRLERNVWEIVSRLPIARQFMLKIEHSERPWEEINDPSIYKQLYMMRVMGLMGDKWWQLFTSGEGLPNLVKKFDRISTSTKIERQYLKMLLEAIDKCLSLPEGNRDINFSELILNLFKALQSLLIDLDEEKIQNKKTSVEIIITANIFKISERLLKEINVISVLLNKLPNFEELLLRGLVKTNSVFLRKQFVVRMIVLNEFIDKQDSEKYLSVIIGRIFEVVRETTQPQQTQQYFEYAASLIKSTQKDIFTKYLKQRNPDLLKIVQNGLMKEKPELTIENVNYMLVGYLQLMKQLIRYASDEFKQKMSQFVLYRCFFTHFENQQSDNKCKSKEARKASFSLLRSILEDGNNITESLSILSGLHKGALWRTRKLDDWTLTPGDKLKSSSGYVGLKNLGCTCYMNSFFQQIFMIPQFRQAILECDDPISEQEIETQNVLFQVKKMFFSLMESERKFYLPNQFCLAFKNYEGQATNVHEQMDIDQFSGVLFDRLQNQMKGTRHENVIKDFFGGVFSNQIICKGCPHFSETQQSFLSVSLSVKNKKNIYQSLDTMIKGDTLDGDNAYFCERCNKKVSAVKRVCLKKLPDHLILTLKRFQFDFETMNKMKINDYCEFPIELNVKQYSQQFLRRQQNPDKFDEEQLLPDSYYDYVLKGVAIHLGYADSGHYYSYINQRKPNGKWFEFNDTLVRGFDPKRLPQEAFGGQVGTFEIKQKIKNAYMLIYERKNKINQYSQYTKLDKDDLLKTPIYGTLSEQIRRENVIQKIQNILFSEQYSAFATELLKKVHRMPDKSSVQLLKYVVLVYLTVTIRQKDEGVSFQFLKKLQQSIINYPEVLEWVVSIFSAQKSLMEFFKNNPAKQVKKLLASWLIQLVRMSRPEVQQKFVDTLLVYTTQNHQNNTEFCYMLFELMKQEKLSHYALSRNVVGRILENLVRKDPTNFKTIEGLYAQESAQGQIGSQIIIERTPYELSKKLKPLVDNSYIWGILYNPIQIAKRENKALSDVISEIEAQYMRIPNAKLYKILEEAKGKFQMKKLANYLAHFAERDQKFSHDMLVYVYKGISEFESKRYRQFFILFKALISIDDQHKQVRNRKGLTFVTKALKQNEKFAFDSNIIQQWIMKTVKKNKYLQKTLISEKEILEYLTILATRKIPTEDICRKNGVFLENAVNKYHGIKMLRSIKKYIELSKEIQKFYLDLAEKEVPKIDEWESDDDLTEVPQQKGNVIGYFDQKETIDFIQAKVGQVFLNRLWISIDKSKIVAIWKDDERLTSSNRLFSMEESSEQILYSQNTTQMDPEDDLDAIS